jgi:predicted PurR-regulated permease PerM
MYATIRITAAALVALGMAIAAPAFAQATQNTQASPQNIVQGTDFSQSQLQKFVQAKAEVEAIRPQWQNKIKNAPGTADATHIRQQATQAFDKAVRSSGLSVDQYNQIARTASNNPNLYQRLQKMMQ